MFKLFRASAAGNCILTSIKEEVVLSMLKFSSKRLFVVAILAVLLAALLIQGLLARPATRINPRNEDPNKVVDANLLFVVSNDSPFEPTSNCKQCHRSLIEEWSTSQHYHGWRDPLFQDNYKSYVYYLESPEPSPAFVPKVEAEEAKAKERPAERKMKTRPAEEAFKVELNVLKVREDAIGQILHGDGLLLPEGIVRNKVQTNCMKCHAPGADLTKDGDMALESNNEGVFCDYCHLVVDRSEQGYLIFPLCKIKQGPYIEPVTASHPTEFSSLHTRSEFCKNCHQYTNPAGVTFLDTYSEWATSKYSQGSEPQTCQDCHMPNYRGRASVASDIREQVKSHYFAGGYNRGFMVDSATCDIKDIEVSPDKDEAGNVTAYHLKFPVEVLNARAGHDFPTGWPLRQMILVVRLKAENYFGQFDEKKILYEKVYGDFWGNRTYNIWEITQILSDNETWEEEGIPRGIGPLAAGEKRQEDIELTLDPAEYNQFEQGDLYVTAQLFYRLTPEGFISEADLPSPFRLHADVEYVMLP